MAYYMYVYSTCTVAMLNNGPPPPPPDLRDKLEAEVLARQQAVERAERSEHHTSMLELDLRNLQDEVAQHKHTITAGNNKVTATCTCTCTWMVTAT